MNWYSLKKLGRYLSIDPENDTGEFEERYNLDPYHIHNQAWDVFKKTKISPDSRQKVREVVLPDKGDNVIGALADSWSKVDGEADKPIWEYSFDLSVLPDFQKQGIGRQLIENAIKTYESEAGLYTEMDDAYTRIKVWAVNPHIARILENEYGFDCEPVAHEKGVPIQWFCYKY